MVSKTSSALFSSVNLSEKKSKKTKTLNFKNSQTISNSYARRPYQAVVPSRGTVCVSEPKTNDGSGFSRLINLSKNPTPVEEILLGAITLGVGIKKRKSLGHLLSGETPQPKANEEVSKLKNLIDELTNKVKEATAKVDKHGEELDVDRGWLNDINNRLGTQDSVKSEFGDRLNKLEGQKHQRQPFAPPALAKDIPEFVENVTINGKFIKKYENNHNLRANVDNDDKKIVLKKATRDKLENEAANRIYNPQMVKKLTHKDTVWCPSFESLPEKEGGMGEVPTQVVNKFVEHGVKVQKIMPLHQIEGGKARSYIHQIGNTNKFKYKYGGKDSVVEKLCEMNVEAFQDGRILVEPVEFFLKKGDPLAKDMDDRIDKILVSNDRYFKTKGMYKNDAKAKEKERTAFFSKAAYEFQKYLLDPSSANSVRNVNEQALKNTKAPSGMLINDSHPGGLVSLNRMKSVIEAEEGILSKEDAKHLNEMPIIYIGHNFDYRGTDGSTTANVMNTLYGRHALDIHMHGIVKWKDVKDDNGNIIKKGEDLGSDIQRSTMLKDSPSQANMGSALADYVVPVSKGYSKDLVKVPGRSEEMHHLFVEREKAGTLKPITNGWDKIEMVLEKVKINGEETLSRDVKHASNMINIDKARFGASALADLHKKMPNGETKEKLASIIGNDVKGLEKTVWNKLPELRELNQSEKAKNNGKGIEGLDHILDNVIGKKREFVTYENKSVEQIEAAHVENKKTLLDYLKGISKDGEKFDLVNPQDNNLEHLNNENIADIPVIQMAVRFVKQKRTDILAETMRRIDKDPDLAGKPKPMWLVGGADSDEATKKNMKFIRDARGKMSPEGKKQVFQYDGFAPGPLFQSTSDIQVMSSDFEPCGSQNEAMAKRVLVAGNPVGGIGETIQDEINGFLGKWDEAAAIEEAKARLDKKGWPYDENNNLENEKTEVLTEGLTDAVKRSLLTFHDNKAKDREMRNAAYSIDPSWEIIKEVPNKDGTKGVEYSGPANEYAKLFGLDFNSPELRETKAAYDLKKQNLKAQAEREAKRREQISQLGDYTLGTA